MSQMQLEDGIEGDPKDKETRDNSDIRELLFPKSVPRREDLIDARVACRERRPKDAFAGIESKK